MCPEAFAKVINIGKFILTISTVTILTANIYWVLLVNEAPCSAFTNIDSFPFSAILGGRYFYYPHFMHEPTEA